MGTFTVTMKTHSREDITIKLKNLNDCIVHHVKPTILKIVAGKRKDIHYVAFCKEDYCGKIDYAEKNIELVWNKWNPKVEAAKLFIEENISHE